MIDLQAARVLLATVRDREGADFQYSKPNQDCFYEPQDYGDTNKDDVRTRVGCIVGEAIKLGDPEMYEGIRRSMKEIGFAAYHGDYVYDEVRNPTGRITAQAVTYFGWAQSSQDEGATWGVAVRVAENAIDTDGMGVRTLVTTS